MMAWPTILTGLALVAIGLVGYLAADPGTDGKVSPTALIPAGFGAVLLVCGALAFNEKLRKHVMHLAAAVGLFGAAGGLTPLIRGGFDFSKTSAVYGALMVLVCVLFVGLCVNSFVQARRARAARGPAAA